VSERASKVFLNCPQMSQLDRKLSTHSCVNCWPNARFHD